MTHACRCIYGPLPGERNVWKVILPDWEVETKRFVALSPVVANAVVCFDDESWYTECF